MPSLGERLRNTWNAFLGRDPTNDYPPYSNGYYSGFIPYRNLLGSVNGKTIVATIINRIAVDCAAINVRHVRLNKDGKYESTIDSSLNDVLCSDANIDQTGRAMIQDAVASMLDEGVIAIFPYEMDDSPDDTDSYAIYKVRVGKIVEWFPTKVRIELYNDLIGQKQQLLVEKRICVIVENPFYSIMNSSNSILQRLTRVLSQLDKTNDESSSGKLNMIIKLPYTIKNESRKQQAEQKRKDIESQLSGDTQLGIAYIDATEQVIQLNRSIDNNLWEQAESLTKDLFNQMGLSSSIFDGTADEYTMLKYYNSTISPIMTAITEEMDRKWLSKTARTRGQAIRFFQDPFRLVPVEQLAKIADTFTRNEIMTSNEIREIIGLRPSSDPKADQLVNANLNQSKEGIKALPDSRNEGSEIQNAEEK